MKYRNPRKKNKSNIESMSSKPENEVRVDKLEMASKLVNKELESYLHDATICNEEHILLTVINVMSFIEKNCTKLKGPEKKHILLCELNKFSKAYTFDIPKTMGFLIDLFIAIGKGEYAIVHRSLFS